MRHVSHYILAAAAAFAAPALAQQSAPRAEDSVVVVEGVRVNERQIDTFVDALTDVEFGGQIGRFERLACPAAVGLLSAEQNADIVSRLRVVAEAAGIEVGEEGCRPNLLVVVTHNKREFIEQLDRRYPAYFHAMSARQVRRLAQSHDPVAVWHVEGRIGPDGQEAPLAVPNFAGGMILTPDGFGRPMQGPDGNLIGGDFTVVDVTYTPGRIRATTRPHFVASVIVAELGALAGLTTTQFADYAAMRTFAETEPARVALTGVPTILKAIDAPLDSAVPLTLTHWDLSFLRALYALPENQFENMQRSNMRRLMTEELVNAAGPAEEQAPPS